MIEYVDGSSRCTRWCIATLRALLIVFILSAATADVSTAQPPLPPGQVKRLAGVLIFDLHPSRMSPSQLTVEEGRYLIRVRNGMSQRELPVFLDDATAARVMDAKVPRGSSGIEKPLLLRPGNHTLRVGSYAEWTASIIVTPEKGK